MPNCSYPRRESSLLLVLLSCGLALSLLAPTQSWAQLTHYSFIELVDGQVSDRFSVRIPVPAGREALLTSASFEVISAQAFAKTDTAAATSPLPADVKFAVTNSAVGFAARRPELVVDLNVERSSGRGNLFVLGRYTYTETPGSLQPRTGPNEPTTSVLAEGRIVKVAVGDDGIYAIDAALLKSLGLSQTGGPSAVRVFTKGGAMLPERVGAAYPIDLLEVALLEQGNGDANWNAGERLLFYGEGEDVWAWDSLRRAFDRTENLYAEETYYYLKVEGVGLRVAVDPELTAATYDPNYTYRNSWEEDKVNLLKFSEVKFNSGQGSGQPFYGDQIPGSRELRRPALWDLGEIPSGGKGWLTSELWAASQGSSSNYSVSLGGQTYRSNQIASAVWRVPESSVANRGRIDAAIALTTPSLDVTVSYPGSAELQLGWIDFVQLNHDAVLRYRGRPLPFRAIAHAAAGNYGFAVQSANSELQILDITDPIQPRRKSGSISGDALRFGYTQETSSTPREFIAFDARGQYPSPAARGNVVNSNLHGIVRADFLIVHGEGLKEAAERLAKHRRAHGGLEVAVVSMSAVAEEFGGGRLDPSGIRNLAAMIYGRDPKLRYLLLLGDGTYDPRQIIESSPPLIPTFQTKVGNSEVYAFPTDDYFALLDEDEGIKGGSSYPVGGLDIAVGRIPAALASDAEAVVDKIIRYDTDPALLGDWRLRNVFVADDEDSNQHVNDIDNVATQGLADFPQFNQTKIYVDAFEQVATSGGQRYPAASEEISRNMFRGNLITTYLGHGGPRGWGLERFLNAPDIERWNAANALPVLVTATCTFTGFDDPERAVIGEQVLFRRNGGVAASLSTTRPVFTNSNFALTKATHNQFLNQDLAARYTIGELLNAAKKSTSGNSNNVQNDRKYSLFGDPAMYLAVPRMLVEVSAIDSVEVATQTVIPAIAPLKEVTLRGRVLTRDSIFARDFNGELQFTVFDQTRVGRTLGQDPDSQVREFDQIGATLFTGSATIVAGLWEAKFMIPIDVSLARGRGRVSLYAKSSDGRDGAGVFTKFIIDGLAPPAVADDTPPVVQVFIGSEAFTAGSVVGENPVLVAKLSDDTGINVSGSAIGHDLTATLRGGSEQSYVVNDFYRSATNDYKRGEVRYPVYGLPKGEYELEVRAWDLANNTTTAVTSFIVADDAAGGLRRVLNYPNPFVDATCFQFEHNAAGQSVEVRVDIYTTAGRLVRSIDYRGVASGSRFGGGDDCISWDGTDDYGQRLGRGVYLYKVRLRTADAGSNAESGFERLVVVR